MKVIGPSGRPGREGHPSRDPRRASRAHHISTGDLFREPSATVPGWRTRRHGARPARPDDITIRMLLDRLGERDAEKGSSSTASPAIAPRPRLDEVLASRGERVELAQIGVLRRRASSKPLSGRRVCRDNGHVYNESSNPPRVPGKAATIDGSPLIQAMTTGRRRSATGWPSRCRVCACRCPLQGGRRSQGRRAASQPHRSRDPDLLAATAGRRSGDRLTMVTRNSIVESTACARRSAGSSPRSSNRHANSN